MIDGELAFVGGIDLTDDAGDRFDTQEHHARRRLGWHDVGHPAARARPSPTSPRTSASRWRELTGEQLPEHRRRPPPAGDSTVQVVRTVAEDMYDALPARATSGSSRATCGRCAAPAS